MQPFSIPAFFSFFIPYQLLSNPYYTIVGIVYFLTQAMLLAPDIRTGSTNQPFLLTIVPRIARSTIAPCILRPRPSSSPALRPPRRRCPRLDRPVVAARASPVPSSQPAPPRRRISAILQAKPCCLDSTSLLSGSRMLSFARIRSSPIRRCLPTLLAHR